MNPNAISAFEYVTILISIILGLGITQLLSSMVEAFYHSKKVKFYLPHIIWVNIILFLHIQDWFILYELKNYPDWKLPTFLFISLYPIVLFSITKLLFPDIGGEEVVDLKIYFLDSFPKVFYLFGICIILSIAFNLYFLGSPLWQQLLLLVPFSIFFYMAYRRVRNEKAHYILAICIALLFFIVTASEYDYWRVK